jgi:hypothetical protein
MLKVRWVDRGYEPNAKPNPEFPHGMDVDLTAGRATGRSCTTDLPYPAKRCGYYLVSCSTCDFRGVVTTAGRADDPRSVKLPCQQKEGQA